VDSGSNESNNDSDCDLEFTDSESIDITHSHGMPNFVILKCIWENYSFFVFLVLK